VGYGVKKLEKCSENAVNGGEMIMNNSCLGVQDGVQDVHDVCDVILWLEQVKKLDELIDAKLAERKQLLDLATKITPEMTGMPFGGGVTDKVGNIAVKLADLARETNVACDRYIDHKAAVIATLEKLPAKEYGVLHREYIRYMTQEEIADDMHYSTVQIWRIKQNALTMLSNVIECYTIPMV
jgi:hypothetical protein